MSQSQKTGIPARQRNEILDLRRASFRAFSQPDGAELRQRADRLAQALLDASTPAMNVDATAPIPGIRIPNLPSAGAMVTLPCFDNRSLLT